MTLLVFGTTGQVGLELQRQVGADAPFLFLGRERADLSDPEACANMISATRPALVINAAAWTDVAGAEAHEAAAHTINAAAPGAMARACAAAPRPIPLIHISSDYVFGHGQDDLPHRPTDPPSPLNAYGRTKLAGEDMIRAAGVPHIILRTSWVISPHGDNFLKKMLRLGAARESLQVVADQVGAPTPAYDLARATLIAGERLLEDRGLSGTYHYQGAPYASWADVAREIMGRAGLPAQIEEVETGETGVPRPRNSRLDCTRTAAALGLRRPDWRRGIGFILKDLGL